MPAVATIALPVVQFVDQNGKPAVGGSVMTYLAGSTTPAPTYADASGTVANPNPVPLNLRGECALWFDQTLAYDLAPTTANGTPLPRQSRITAPGAAPLPSFPMLTPQNFGAVVDDTTDDTASLNAFLAAAFVGFMPSGTYRCTGKLNFRSGQRIGGSGSGTVINYAESSPLANAPVLDIASLTGVVVSGIQVQVNPSTYPTARVLHISGSTNCHFEDIKLVGGGGNAGYIENSTRCSIKGVEVDDYRGNGFQVIGGERCVIEGNTIPNGAGGEMGVQFISGFGHVARNNEIALTPDTFFGIHCVHVLFPEIDGNVIRNTRREALAVGGSGYGARITGNTLMWDTNLGIGDFGMSIDGDDASNIMGDFLIDGNTIIGSALDAIGIAGWCQRGIITNNVIRDCAQAHASGFQSGIKLYGYLAGAVVDDMLVTNNTISNLTGGMIYAVHESNEDGIVNRTTVSNNHHYGFAGPDIYHLESPTSVLSLNFDDLALKPYTPTVTAMSGTLTTVAAVHLDYQVTGRFVHCILNFNITTNGSGAGQLIVTLPFVPSGGTLIGYEGSINGKSIKAGPTGSNSLAITNFDNTYPGVSGGVYQLSGLLRIN